MSEPSSSLFGELSTQQMELVDDACLRFEAAWKTGSVACLEDFLADVDEPTRSVLSGELQTIDWEYRHGKMWHWIRKEHGAVRGGPFSWTELKEFAEQGRLGPKDVVSRKGMESWVPAAEIFHIFTDRTNELDAGAPRPPISEAEGRTNELEPSPDSTPKALTADAPDANGTADPLTFPRVVASSDTVRRHEQAETADDRPRPSIPGYDIVGVLGRGAMGQVFKARQTQLGGRLVALKVIVTGQVAAAEELARFRLEADSLASLNNPNIVQVHEVGEWFTGNGSATLPYFSMEFVDGGTLAQRLAKNPQPPRDAAHMLARIVRAVHAAHERGIIHRDLKPGNILLAAAKPAAGDMSKVPLSELIPKISDFGLAKHLHSDADLTQTGRLLGTPAYMAPEQAVGKVKDIGPATDVYALGAILYEMLTGRPPFTSADNAEETIPAILEQVRNNDPLPPGRLVSRLPRDLDTICMKCLEKDPRKRYGSAHDLADELDCFLAHKPIKARPVTGLERTWRWCRRNPTGAVLAGVLIGLVPAALVAMAFLLWEAQHSADAYRRQFEQGKIHEEILAKKSEFDAGPVREVGREPFRIEGKMTQNGFVFRLRKDQSYAIDLRSANGEPYLLIWDGAGKLQPVTPFMRNWEFGGSARVIFRPPHDGDYRVMIVFRETGPANYILSIQERDPNDLKKKFSLR